VARVTVLSPIYKSFN